MQISSIATKSGALSWRIKTVKIYFVGHNYTFLFVCKVIEFSVDHGLLLFCVSLVGKCLLGAVKIIWDSKHWATIVC